MHQPRKRFGQNFLHDPGTVRRILDAVRPVPGERLVEIGPGQGAITGGLLAATGALDAIELDRDLVGPLAERFAGRGELRIHNADALRFDLGTLGAGPGALRLIGNLPYNISTPLLFRFLEQSEWLCDLHLMLQREVGERIVAAPGGKDYGRLSVMVQTWCEAECLFRIGPGAFTPAPKVESVFLRLRPHRPLPWPPRDRETHARLVAAAFSQRRKTLRNSLQGLADAAAFTAAGIDPGLRAEALEPAAFVRLADAVGPGLTLQTPRHDLT